MRKSTVVLGSIAVVLVLWSGFALSTLTSREGTPGQVETEPVVETTEPIAEGTEPAAEATEPYVMPSPIGTIIQTIDPETYATSENPTVQTILATIQAMDPTELAALPTAQSRPSDSDPCPTDAPGWWPCLR